MLALRNVAKARGGVAAMARETGMNRVALSRALSEGGNPELRSLTKILEASGLEFIVVPKGKKGVHRGPRARTKLRTAASRDVRRAART
jgi:DNA-binding phage protein